MPHTHAHMHARTHTHAHARTGTRTRTHACMHAHTHEEVKALTFRHEPRASTLEFGFDFDVKSDSLYKLLMPGLPVALATDFHQVGQTNGFELFRRLVQKMAPPRADSSFHLANEIRGLGGANLCKDFNATVQFVKFLDSRMDE